MKPLSLDLQASKASVSEEGGTYFLLHDEQVKGDEHTSYLHFASKYLTEGAVEDDSQITISVNPAYQTLTINSLLIHRDGKVLDRLPKQEVKLLQRESRLDWNLFDGRLSAVIILDDVRVGDVVEYSYTLRGANPIFGRHFMDTTYLEWTEPVETFRYRLLWPSDRFLGFKSHRVDLAPTILEAAPGVTEYVWAKENIPSRVSEGDTPSWYDAWAWVQFSDFKSWNEVARWAHAIYPIPKKIPEELAVEIGKIREIKDRKAQVLAALRYVQDNIRYLGIEVGANSHEPHPVEVVLQRRFGDCKDKSLMLSIMLRELGVEAYPALVSTDSRKSIADWLPSPLAFNHVVTQVLLEGKTYWVDPTNQKQGGSLDEIYFPAYGWALVVRPETTALTEIQPAGFAETSTRIAETFEFKDFKGDATLRVRSVYSGEDADSMRSYIADTRRSDVRRHYLNYYARQFPGIEVVDAPKFQDDLEKNILIGEESYLIKKFWTLEENKTKKNFVGDFSAGTVRAQLQSPDTPQRSMPLALAHPARVHHEIELLFPRRMNFSNEKTTVEDPAFKFVYEAKSTDNKLSLSYDYETRRDFVEPDKVSTYLTRQQSVRDVLGYRVTIPPSWVSGAAGEQPAAAESEEAMAEKGELVLKIFGLLALFMVVAAGVGFVIWRAMLRKPQLVPPPVPLHYCAFCGVTDTRDITAEFRVADDGHEYCSRHLPPRP